jgi:hypothetical protein
VKARYRLLAVLVVSFVLAASCRSASGPDTSQVEVEVVNLVSASSTSGRSVSFDLRVSNRSAESVFALSCAMRFFIGTGPDARVIGGSLCGDGVQPIGVLAHTATIFHYAIRVAEADLQPNATYTASIVISLGSANSDGHPISSGIFVIP